MLQTVTVLPSEALVEPQKSFDYAFEGGDEGWETGFADLLADYDQDTYELEAGFGPLPDGLDGNGIMLQGHNRSDDLFMYVTRQVGGLEPLAT